jgi:tetrahydromethanopterin S-methyltransferase subunit F
MGGGFAPVVTLGIDISGGATGFVLSVVVVVCSMILFSKAVIYLGPSRLHRLKAVLLVGGICGIKLGILSTICVFGVEVSK